MRTVVLAFLLATSARASAAEPTPAEVFEKRIVPIFNSPNPSSCVQCHLAGVDLKQYILPDADKTFRSLRDQGLIDLDAPEKSKIVKLIDMGGSDAKGPNAVHAKARKAEREAFLAWLTACAADPKMRAAPKLADGEAAKPPRPDAVIRHARRDRVLESFEENVWAWRFRCMNCHTEGTPQNDKHRLKHGDAVAWVKKGGAGETMDYLIGSKLIDPANPEKSLLLRKPLGEKHEGGVKFVVGDDAYKGFRRWIEDVAAIRGDRYTAAKDLPDARTAVAKFGTDIWFKLDQTPPDWGDQFLQARVFAWDATKQAWEPSPVAVTDRVVFGKGRVWQHNLTLLAAKDSERARAWRAGTPTLPEGKYLMKVFVDREGRLAKDWMAELKETDFVGQAEFRGRWREGYGAMTVVNAGTVKK
jgi:hypothetical protein